MGGRGGMDGEEEINVGDENNKLCYFTFFIQKIGP